MYYTVTTKLSVLLVFLILSFTAALGSISGELRLSRNPDFSTDDRVFSRDDTMFILVTAPDIDFTDIDDNQFRLKPDDGGNDFEGSFTNNFDGTYQGKINLASADPGETNWELEVRIDDEGGREFRVKVEVQIPTAEQSDEFEVRGTIQAINHVDSTLTVRDVTFEITSSTEIRGDDESILLSDLAVGDRVEIRGIRVGQSIIATRIRIDDEEIEDDEVEITGIVTAIGGDFLTVAGFTFKVSESTKILDDNEQEVSFSVIKVGFVVEVRADVLADETLLATKIEIEDRFKDEVEIKGLIQSINLNDSLLLVGDLEVFVTDSTQILDDDDNPVDLSFLSVGMLVALKADVQADGRLLARKIEIEDRFDDDVKLTGTIESIGSGANGDTLVVARTTVFVSANTTILDNNNHAIAFGDLMPGLIVEIRAIFSQNGKLVATQIEVEDRIEDEVELTGVIEKIVNTASETSITVLGRTFVITDNSVIFDENNSVINIGMLFIGQVVEVRGDLLADGTLIAIRIKLEDREGDEIEVVGPIDSFGSGPAKTVIVVGIVFFVTDTTAIIDEQNNAIPFSELRVGQTVEVRALGQPNGTRVATRIKVEDVVLLSAVVERVAFNGVSMLGKDVLFDSNTLILGKLNMFLSVQDLAEGQFVQVRAQQNGNNVVFGTKIKIQGEGVVTSVSDTPGNHLEPKDFILLMNYPNPFNPQTTIIFEVPHSNNGLLRTQVTIFNLLGQEVRTLVDEPLSSGIHEKRWDGRDGNGVLMPTGVYLYQLQSGSIKKTERMLLIK